MECFCAGLRSGMPYKFAVTNGAMNHTVYKCDPYAITSELRPKTASVINLDTEYTWNDSAWLEERSKRNHFNSPMNTPMNYIWHRGKPKMVIS